MTWKILKSSYPIKNSFLTVRKDKAQKPDGTIVENYYTIEKPDIAIITAITEKNEIILIKQYRHPVKSVRYEIPAGYMEKSDKTILQTAKRELLEETGYKASKFIKIRSAYASAGNMDNTVHFFIAFNAKKIDHQNLDKNEEIEVKVVPVKKALKLLKEENIMDLGSATGVMLTLEYLKQKGIIDKHYT